MYWYRDLTTKQQAILMALAVSVIAVTGLLGWSVWSTLHAPPNLSPLPTPSQAESSPLATPSPQPSDTPYPTPTPTSTPVPSFDVSTAGVIASKVAEARQTPNRWGTPLTLVEGIDMARAIYTHDQTWPPLALRMQTVLQAMHLWFWSTLRLDVVTQASQTAAYYAPELEELYLRRDWKGSMTTLETQLAYGYARALPDQYGNLTSLVQEASSLDRQLALMAVAEGNALLSVCLYRHATPGTSAAHEIQTQVAQAICPLWQVDDPLLSRLSCLSLELGEQFATARYDQGGTAALDDDILRPPRSTEQMLHPELYAEEPDEPTVLTPVEPALDRGFVLTATDTVGEVLMGIIVDEWSNGQAGPETVVGWDGDLLQIWEGPEGESAVAWQTVWDDSQTAGRFYGALLDMMPKAVVPGLIRDTTAPTGLPRGRWWAGAQGAAFLYRHANLVWIVWGDNPDTVEALGAALP